MRPGTRACSVLSDLFGCLRQEVRPEPEDLPRPGRKAERQTEALGLAIRAEVEPRPVARRLRMRASTAAPPQISATRLEVVVAGLVERRATLGPEEAVRLDAPEEERGVTAARSYQAETAIRETLEDHI